MRMNEDKRLADKKFNPLGLKQGRHSKRAHGAVRGYRARKRSAKEQMAQQTSRDDADEAAVEVRVGDDATIRDARYSHEDADGTRYARALRGTEVVEVRVRKGETSWRPLGAPDGDWRAV